MNSINKINFKGKKVLVRVDFNVPVDDNQRITDDTRIRESLPTINKLLGDGASVILMAHFGRPKKGGFEKELSLEPIAKHCSKLLGQEVIFSQDLFSDKSVERAREMKDGQVMLLENIRFYPEETKGDEGFAERLSKLGDAYVNDAFGAAHREHVSTAIIAKYFPESKYFGLLMESEVNNLEKLMRNPQRPFTAIIGGAKVSSKIDVIKNLIPIADNIIIGGGMAYTFHKSMGFEIGDSLCEDDKLDIAKELLEEVKDGKTKIYLPQDQIIADRFDNNANRMETKDKNIKKDWMGMDIGPKAVEEFENIILESKTILWNGPMGVFEMSNFSKGSFAIAEAIAKASEKGAFSAVGGGDSVAAINQSGFADKMSYISTGGGAMLEYLEGKTLPGIRYILEK